jgi:hypothetical protein
LLQDTVQSSRRKIIGWFAGNRYAAEPHHMLILSMAAARGDKEPAFFL